MNIPKILQTGFSACWLYLFTLLLPTLSTAQTASSYRLLEFKYGFLAPAGDLEKRFGISNDIGISLEHVGLEKKVIIGLEGYYIFGTTVKEDVLEELRTYEGSIIGLDGGPGDIVLKQRGFYIGAHAGKLFHTGKYESKLTGIRILAGGGLLQHKIRIQDNLNTVVALEKKYQLGYDRLTNGPAIHLGAGYHYQSPTGNFQFNIMGDLFAAFTKSRRDIDYLTGTYNDETRTDLAGGISVSYVVLISRKDKPENIYY